MRSLQWRFSIKLHSEAHVFGRLGMSKLIYAELIYLKFHSFEVVSLI